jgi:hypothetical protein
VVIIESTQVWLAPILVLCLLVSSIFSARKHALHFFAIVKSNPMSQFTVMTAVGIVLGLAIYFMLTGGFVEPSKYSI